MPPSAMSPASQGPVSSCKAEPKMPMDRLDAGPEVRKFRGRGNRGRGSYIYRGDRGIKRQMPIGREKFRDKPMNGVVPLRRGMGRMHPYQDPRGRGGTRGQHPGYLPPHLEIEMSEPFPPPPPLPRRGHPLPPLPPGRMGFRGMPPPPRGRPILPPLQQRGPFPHPRGFPNGRGAPPPPGRGQRWPVPPGGRRF